MGETDIDFRSVAELCRQSGVGYWALNKHIRLGELPSFKLGNVRYIKQSDFDIWFSTYKKWGRIKRKAEVETA